MTHGDGYSHANGANIDDNDDRNIDEAVDEDDGISTDDNDNDNDDRDEMMMMISRSGH